jgi:hypothetical protein
VVLTQGSVAAGRGELALGFVIAGPSGLTCENPRRAKPQSGGPNEAQGEEPRPAATLPWVEEHKRTIVP